MKLGIIGAGNLGKAIISALKEENIQIKASSLHPQQYEGISIITDNKSIAKASDIIILAVKPKDIPRVIGEIKEESRNKLVLSFAAGITLEFLESRLNSRIARVMTNLAVKKKKGISVYKTGKSCNHQDKAIIEGILSRLGKCIEVKEEKIIDTATAVSGSGLAYFIEIISIFIASTESYTNNKELSRLLVLETIKGATALIEESPGDYKGIITSIASKGGTTEEGLKAMKAKGLSQIIKCVLDKTIDKCRKIGAESTKQELIKQ